MTINWYSCLFKLCSYCYNQLIRMFHLFVSTFYFFACAHAFFFFLHLYFCVYILVVTNTILNFYADHEVFLSEQDDVRKDKLSGALVLQRVAGLTLLSFRDKTVWNFLAELESWKIPPGASTPPPTPRWSFAHRPRHFYSHTLREEENVLITFLGKRPFVYI